jgi:hypothetical protein
MSFFTRHGVKYLKYLNRFTESRNKLYIEGQNLYGGLKVREGETVNTIPILINSNSTHTS